MSIWSFKSWKSSLQIASFVWPTNEKPRDSSDLSIFLYLKSWNQQMLVIFTWWKNYSIMKIVRKYLKLHPCWFWLTPQIIKRSKVWWLPKIISQTLGIKKQSCNSMEMIQLKISSQIKSDISPVSLWLAAHTSLTPADLHLQGAAALSSTCCTFISMLLEPRAPPPLAVPTVRGVMAYSVEFINLFATPTESAWQRLEITP